MRHDGTLPDVDELFGVRSAGSGDESRSVHSPAAYLADLLRLLDDDGGAPPALAARRPDIPQVPLDAENTYTQLPYLDIVNEVLEGAVTDDGADPYRALRTQRSPFTLPFSLRHERLKRYLHHLGVDAADLYRAFATGADKDTVAREYLGLTPDDVTIVTTELTDGPELRQCYQLQGGESFAVLEDVERFRRVTQLTTAELNELLFQDLCPTSGDDGPPELDETSAFFIHQGGTTVTPHEDGQRLRYGTNQPVPVEWFERVNRFVRLARRTGLTLSALDLVLRDCCGNRIDAAALHTIAVVVHLQRDLDLPLDVVVSLLAPITARGFGTGPEPQDLFDRVFNRPFVATERTFVRGSRYRPPGYADLAELSCAGDILAARNAAYRRRITAALSISDGDLAAVVTRYRRGDGPGPFDGEIGPAALSILHRITRLASALGIAVAELFELLDALDRDPSIQRHPAFPILIDPGVSVDRVDTALTGDDVAAGLWLAQTLVGAVRWMRAGGMTGGELIGVLGGAAVEPADATDGPAAVLARLVEEFAAVELAADLFVSDRFSERAAQVVHSVVASDVEGVVSARDDRLLRVEPDRAASTAYAAVTALAVVVAADFCGLGLGERDTAKVFTNLVLAGHLEPDGTLAPDRLPETPAGLRLSGTFAAYRDPIFALIAGDCIGQDGDVPAETAACYPSDLVEFTDLTAAEQAELYDNLVFNGYLDPDGLVVRPDFFMDQANVEAFTVDAGLGDLAAEVHARLLERVVASGRDKPMLDPAIFAGLGLDDTQLADLLGSLRFNGYLDGAGRYTDPAALLTATVADLRLALEYYPYRRRVLDAMQAQLAEARANGLRMTEHDFHDIADAAAAQRVFDALNGTYLVDGRVPADRLAFFADSDNTLTLDGRTADENSTIFNRVAAVLADARPYQLDLGALADLGFDADQQVRILDHLVAAGHLTATLTIPEDRLDHFSTVHNALGFTFPGLEDFRTDVFFLLHYPAVEVRAGIAEITAALSAGAARQRAAAFTVLQDAFGVPAETMEAICAAVAGGSADALDLLVAPALAATPSTVDGTLGRAFRRIRGFARLAAKLSLDADEVALVFRDQNLVDKFAEPLALPAGVDRIDALLESSDGFVYLFHDNHVWTYTAGTYALTDPSPKQLTDLSGRFVDVARVDAAFVDADGSDWIVGRDDEGAALAFVRQRGSGRWAPRQRDWGTVANNFADPARIDAAFVDHDGRTYLFCGDQYVRYSGTDHSHVDEGYPRRIGDWWEAEQQSVALPGPLRHSLDAAFRGHDGRTYLFAGDQFVAVGTGNGTGSDGGTDAGGAQPVAGTWGKVRNELAGAQRIDAGYATGPEQFLFAGDQVVRYSDSIENHGVYADAGYPRRIAAQIEDLPAEFESGLTAAFVDPAGVTHLFTGDRTIALGGKAEVAVVPTASRWGLLDPVLPSDTVDAAFVGLDGRTYLFSGDRYLRYSGADYSTVDIGYPRTIAGDWGGLRQVDAAFVLDGTTFLFGTAGLIFDLPADFGPGLDTGRPSRALRQRFANQGITVAEDAKVTGQSPTWRLTADGPISLTLQLVDTRIQVHVDPSTAAQFHVRYSTRDCVTPDPGYPRPVADNWWNLPDELAGEDFAPARVDAVLTARDDRTYLFSGEQFVVLDNKRRWWSQVKSLTADWATLPFRRVDAAFVGADERTYVFSGPEYVRYTGSIHTRADERYPAPIAPFWGNVANTIARTGRVDAALVTDEHTYLFSGDQFVRYTGTRYATVDTGYPKRLDALSQEPRLANLHARLERVDAAFADRRNVYLFDGGRWHVVSDAAYRRYTDLPGPVRCAHIEDGAVLVERPDGWHRYSALEGATVSAEPARPRSLRAVPPQFRSGLSAVLHGVDGNTYLFKGASCFNTALNREYPLAEEWGRPRNGIYHDNRVDAAFVGVDGRTYVFSGDQFVTYPGVDYLDAEIEAQPRPIAEHWAGLRAVALAFTRDDVTYLFEVPDAAGTSRYVTYSGKDYSRPDDGYPATADASYWDIPDHYRPAGFTLPDAVLFEGDTMLVLTGGVCLQRDKTTGVWSYPRPLERLWPGIGRTDGLTAAFTGQDTATYFFFAGEFTRYHDGTFTARAQIRDRWGHSRNNFLASDGTVDAAVVARGVTYLFSGDQYARYSGDDYRYADAGYPRPIAGNLRTEEAFTNLPVAFDDELAERAAAGNRRLIDAVVANDRSTYVFAGGACHVVSRALSASYDLAALGRVRNNLADGHRVDAALVTDGHTYLFSGDQYVRYAGRGYGHVDDGYPRPIATGLPDELAITALPPEFHDRVDAAFQDANVRTYLFAGKAYTRVEGTSAAAPAPVAGAWGVVHNGFRPGAAIDAAFLAPTGELYAFAGGQYVRYGRGRLDTVEQGYPRAVENHWGDLPTTFERGVDGAFTLAGRTYLSQGTEYVRVDGEDVRPGEVFEAVEPVRPQPFRHRWTDRGDYRLSDVRVISRFAELARAYPGDGGLAAFLLPGPRTYADPYRHLADLFGWDVDELRWCRRHNRSSSGAPDDEVRFEIEFLLDLVDLFAVTDTVGAGPSRVHADVWLPLYEGGADVDFTATAAELDAADASLDAAGAALYGLLARRHSAADWAIRSQQIHDELNVRRRDALVAAVIARSAGQLPEFRTSRDLFEWFLIDVDMGGQGRTSRVREAIAATQLYIHRYLIDLEEGTPAGTDPALVAAARQRVKALWTWMRSYRTWEANRKVFLYPENYLRPELRSTRTPAFRALENDLLQGEITPETVDRAYKRYLDEYTEVSRLTIAGGYVYTKDQAPDGPRRLVLFGRTRTDPRRYYYRRAEFGGGARPSATWEPWLPVDVQIDADHVHPVHAFGRVFVFWATTEAVAATNNPDTPTRQVRISYSFYNLNKEWVPAQTLGTGPAEVDAMSGVRLLVRPRLREGTDRTSVLISASYTVTPAATETGTPPPRQVDVLFDLNPEMYAESLNDPADPGRLTTGGAAILADLNASDAVTATADRVAGIFVDPVDPADVVRFDHPTGAHALSWFSVDHKGGSFLCRPVTDSGPVPAPVSLDGNQDRLPAWDNVDAAVELPDGSRYFFDNTAGHFAAAAPDSIPGTPAPIGTRWGRQRVVLPAGLDVVNAVLTRGPYTFVFSDTRYVRFTGTPFEAVDPGYPKDIRGNEDELPDVDVVDAAFTGQDGIEYFRSGDTLITLGGTEEEDEDDEEEAGNWFRTVAGFGRVDAALVTDGHTFLISGGMYLKYTHTDGGTYGEPDWTPALPLADNKDGLPTDIVVNAALWRDGTAYYFDNDKRKCHETAGAIRRSYRYLSPTPAVATDPAVDAAWVANGGLYLTRGTEYVRYSLTAGQPVPDFVDDDYPKLLDHPIVAAFTRDDDVYLFTALGYTRVDATAEPDTANPRPVTGIWGGLPAETDPPFVAAMDSASGLYLFVGEKKYVAHPKTTTIRRPYERAALPFELIRLTTGTASDLNRTLLSGGVPALLQLSTQETDEVALSTGPEAATAIRVSSTMVDPERLPAGSHLDFRSANGLYYWEIFFHAPLLIAQALNNAQRFEYARQWYEYVFDPTNGDSCWRFLPFLSIDLGALADSIAVDIEEVLGGPRRTAAEDLDRAMEPVLTALRTLAPAALDNRGPVTERERTALATATSTETLTGIDEALTALEAKRLTAGQRAAVTSIRERTAIVAGLEKQFDLLGDEDGLLRAYRDNPFDPHAIANLRPVALRRAVVMAYLDNLLDWGDLLFRQYTPESIDEARMLYILAHDLIGERGNRLGTRLLPAAQSFADLVAGLTAGGALVEGAGAVNAIVGDGYFHVPDNSVFDGYDSRVVDRLRKIRQSLNILGISQPLPLFEPALDPMGLVRGVASGAAVDALDVAAAVAPPAYRFAVVFRKAQELVDKLRQFGTDLLTVLERRDAEELSLMQSRQEATILALTRDIRQAQIRIAEEQVAELAAAQSATQDRASHYENLIATGMSGLERAQLDVMADAARAHFASSVLKVASGIAHLAPQINAGPFILGLQTGGEQIGQSLDKASEVAESLGEGFSVLGEMIGLQAQHERTAADWELQAKTARGDLAQLGHQITGATHALALARGEAELLDRQIAHHESVTAFMRDKFGTAELYGWMSGQLSALYFQAYHLAYEMAKTAERAFQFERGVPEATATHIRPTYWESRRGGLLAGESLGLDLDRLGKAYLDIDARGLEITKQISLLALDPLALLRLRERGTCEFALTEADFDHDFPGHFRRQLRTLTVNFVDADGNPTWVNATLTQLGHKTVLEADPQAVRYLLDPRGLAPQTVRGDWRPSQRIALSEVDGDNNGLFELRFDDDRYLPFEGTGAVSTWRLERPGRMGTPPHDVVITVRYTAQAGDEAFTSAVKGMLKPYTAARYFDVAREFPTEWSAFVEDDSAHLALPLTPDLFPGMNSRRIAAIYPTYDTADGVASRLVLNGNHNLALREGTLLPTPGLTIGADASQPLSFTVDGDKQNLYNVGLVLTYQANVR
jgi:hypothetical protein